MKITICYLTICAAIFTLYGCNSNKDSKDAADSVNRVKDRTLNVMARGTLGTDLPDANFATKIAARGLAEVELGKLVLTDAASTQLKDFAKIMISDYNKINKELALIAQKKNISLPLVPDNEDQKKIDELHHKAGEDFDDTYLEAVADAQKKALQLMQDESKNSKDPDIKIFAARTIPVIQSHLDMINKIHPKTR